MARDWNRRELVKTLGAAGLLASAASPAGALFALAPRRRPARTREGLADRILATPRERVFELVEPLLRDGLSWEDLQAASYEAGIREIGPRPVGNKLHAVLAIESVYQLAAGRPEGERGMAVLWNLDEIKASQERDLRQGDWKLPPRPKVSFASRAQAENELRAAFEAFDEERADRAAVGLLACADRQGSFEVLWPLGMREHVGLCHRTLFTVHAERILRRVGDELLEPTVRSLVHGLFEAPPGRTLGEYEASRKLASMMPETGEQARPSLESARSFALFLRGATPAEARARLVSDLREGAHPGSHWDGLRLAAAELFTRSPGLLAVHGTTVTNALQHVFRSSEVPATRRLALLQACSWMPLFRERFVRGAKLAPQADPIGEQLAEAGSPGAERLAAAHREHLFGGIRESHEAKYAAAVLEDVAAVAPALRARLLAPALAYLPTEATATTDLARRSRELLKRVAG